MVIERPAKTKITNFDVTVLTNEDICWFDIPVYHIYSM